MSTEPRLAPGSVASTNITARSSRVRTNALVSLGIICAALLLAQPASIPVSNVIRTWIYAGSDTQSQWTAYLARPKAPDVLFVGDSATRMDVDVAAVASELSTKSGRPVDVAKIGANGERAAWMSALVMRVMSRPSKPLLIVFELTDVTFNATTDGWWDPSVDLFQISLPADLAYMRYAYSVDNNPGHLARDWAVPFFVAAPVFAFGATCVMVEGARRASGPTPPGFLRQPSGCEDARLPSPDAHVTPYTDNWTRTQLYGPTIANYRFSEIEAGYARNAVALARAGQTQIVFAVYPFLNLDDLNPAAHPEFDRRTSELASSLNVKLVDLYHSSVRDDKSLWGDPVHLNRWGARALAPSLADGIASELPAQGS
jgi:hypothetical protein